MTITSYHAKYFAYELTKRCASDSLEKLSSTLSNAQVDLNPHQIEAEPMQFICLDKAFGGNDQLKANAVQTFNARNMGKKKHNQIIFRTV
jgi:hypothetical protein